MQMHHIEPSGRGLRLRASYATLPLTFKCSTLVILILAIMLQHTSASAASVCSARVTITRTRTAVNSRTATACSGPSCPRMTTVTRTKTSYGAATAHYTTRRQQYANVFNQRESQMDDQQGWPSQRGPDHRQTTSDEEEDDSWWGLGEDMTSNKNEARHEADEQIQDSEVPADQDVAGFDSPPAQGLSMNPRAKSCRQRPFAKQGGSRVTKTLTVIQTQVGQPTERPPSADTTTVTVTKDVYIYKTVNAPDDPAGGLTEDEEDGQDTEDLLTQPFAGENATNPPETDDSTFDPLNDDAPLNNEQPPAGTMANTPSPAEESGSTAPEGGPAASEAPAPAPLHDNPDSGGGVQPSGDAVQEAPDDAAPTTDLEGEGADPPSFEEPPLTVFALGSEEYPSVGMPEWNGNPYPSVAIGGNASATNSGGMGHVQPTSAVNKEAPLDSGGAPMQHEVPMTADSEAAGTSVLGAAMTAGPSDAPVAPHHGAPAPDTSLDSGLIASDVPPAAPTGLSSLVASSNSPAGPAGTPAVDDPGSPPMEMPTEGPVAGESSVNSGTHALGTVTGVSSGDIQANASESPPAGNQVNPAPPPVVTPPVAGNTASSDAPTAADAPAVGATNTALTNPLQQNPPIVPEAPPDGAPSDPSSGSNVAQATATATSASETSTDTSTSAADTTMDTATDTIETSTDTPTSTIETITDTATSTAETPTETSTSTAETETATSTMTKIVTLSGVPAEPTETITDTATSTTETSTETSTSTAETETATSTMTKIVRPSGVPTEPTETITDTATSTTETSTETSTSTAETETATSTTTKIVTLSGVPPEPTGSKTVIVTYESTVITTNEEGPTTSTYETLVPGGQTSVQTVIDNSVMTNYIMGRPVKITFNDATFWIPTSTPEHSTLTTEVIEGKKETKTLITKVVETKTVDLGS